MMKLLLCAATVLVCALIASAMPFHASCKLTWTFGLNCSDVKDRLVTQIKTWNMLTEDLCTSSGSEKCLYDLTSATANEIKAIHMTPKKHYKDDLTFTLSNISSGGCTVKGFSTSETIYAVLDSGTNYCNLRNLADGSGLSTSQGFKENTSNSICTQYSSRNYGDDRLNVIPGVLLAMRGLLSKHKSAQKQHSNCVCII